MVNARACKLFEDVGTHRETETFILHYVYLCARVFLFLVVFVFVVGLYVKQYSGPFLVALFYLAAPIFWYRELDSDVTVAKYVDGENLISALSILYNGRLDSYSFYHPSVNHRAYYMRKHSS